MNEAAMEILEGTSGEGMGDLYITNFRLVHVVDITKKVGFPSRSTLNSVSDELPELFSANSVADESLNSSIGGTGTGNSDRSAGSLGGTGTVGIGGSAASSVRGIIPNSEKKFRTNTVFVPWGTIKEYSTQKAESKKSKKSFVLLVLHCKDFRRFQFRFAKNDLNLDVINEILEAHLQTQQMLLKTQSQAFAWDYSNPRWRSSELNGWNVYDPVKEFARQGVGHTLDSLNSGILGGTNGIGAKYYGRGQLSSSYTGISIPQASLKESGESTDNSPQLGSIASSSPSTGRRIPPSPKRQQFRQLRQQQSQQRQILSTGQRRRQNPNWRISVVNSNYALIPTYPKVFVVPFNMDDAAIRKKVHLRKENRIPILSWVHWNSAALVRSSQPTSSTLRKEEDGDLFMAILETRPLSRLFVVDCRSKIQAEKNRSHVNIDGIPGVESLIFLDIETQWLQCVSKTLEAADRLVGILENGDSVLVYCTDGTEITPLVTSLTMFLSDSFYRTMKGFAALIEQEWISLGHPFSLLSKYHFSMFTLFLDCVNQITLLFPAAVEFSSTYLVVLLDEFFSQKYGTFLFDTEFEREKSSVRQKTCSLWSFMNDPRHLANFRNPFYSRGGGVGGAGSGAGGGVGGMGGGEEDTDTSVTVSMSGVDKGPKGSSDSFSSSNAPTTASTTTTTTSASPYFPIGSDTLRIPSLSISELQPWIYFSRFVRYRNDFLPSTSISNFMMPFPTPIPPEIHREFQAQVLNRNNVLLERKVRALERQLAKMQRQLARKEISGGVTAISGAANPSATRKDLSRDPSPNIRESPSKVRIRVARRDQGLSGSNPGNVITTGNSTGSASRGVAKSMGTLDLSQSASTATSPPQGFLEEMLTKKVKSSAPEKRSS